MHREAYKIVREWLRYDHFWVTGSVQLVSCCSSQEGECNGLMFLTLSLLYGALPLIVFPFYLQTFSVKSFSFLGVFFGFLGLVVVFSFLGSGQGRGGVMQTRVIQ